MKLLPKNVSENDTFATLDVVSLYSNITHDLGVRALKYWLENFPDEIGRFPPEFIIESVELILKNNYFEFNDRNFLQVTGTAMGTKFAPVYANLVLGYLEISLYDSLVESFTHEIADKIMQYYIRYIDDIFIIWNENIGGDINAFRDLLGSLDNKLSFTLDQYGQSVSFLDVMVSLKDKDIITDIFYKKTDSKRYLDYRSCHPRHIKNNVPFNLARRICTIVSENDTLRKRLQQLHQYLEECNYPVGIIIEGINKALNIPKEALRERKKDANADKDKIPFVTTYNPNYQNNFNVISLLTQKLKNNPQTEDSFKTASLINSRRQPHNLKRILTRAHFTNKTDVNSVSKCNDKKCQLCKIIIEGSSFVFNNGMTFKVNANMDCNTLNCIYVIKCVACSLTYIGETCNFRLRVNNHRDHSKKNVALNVNRHLYRCNPDAEIKFKIMPFFKINRDDTLLRKNKESYFIKKFRPELNSS